MFQKIISALLKILLLHADETIKYMMGLAVFSYISYWTYSCYFYKFDYLFNEILLCLKINRKIDVKEILVHTSK